MKAHLPALATLTLLLAACNQAAVPQLSEPAAQTGNTLTTQDLVVVNINDVVPTGNVTKEPGQSGSASFYLTPTNGDNKPGCNATGNGNQVTFSIESDNKNVIADVGPSTPVTGCEQVNAQSLTYTVSPSAPVGTIVTLTVKATGSRGTNTPKTFQVEVVPPTPTDTTAPVITPLITGTQGQNGWYTGDVTVVWNATDAQSGITSAPCETVIVQEDTEGQTLTCTATSAGGTATASVTIKRDATAPTTTIAAGGTQGLNDWFTGDVTFTTSREDLTSGIENCQTTGTDPLISDTGSHTASITCTDNAGNTGSAAVTVKRDATAPTATVTPSGTLGQNGWYTSDVTFTTAGQDTLSGVNACTNPDALTADSAAHTVTGTCTDNAGNTSPLGSVTVKRDATAPILSLPAVVNATATGNSQATVTYTASADGAISGLANLICTPASGSVLPVGTTTATCTATDNAGNVATGTFPIKVTYAFTGFFQPVDMGGVVNTVKAGSAVPIKFKLGGYQGMNILAPNAPVSAPNACGGSDAPIEETVTAGGSSLTWDATAGQYVYVWKTSNFWSGQCRTFSLTLADGTTQKAYFRFK